MWKTNNTGTFQVGSIPKAKKAQTFNFYYSYPKMKKFDQLNELREY